jgi:hypothetical protein
MVLLTTITVAPWTIRNYLVFGRWIPLKSNLAYELYQSHCLQPDGILEVRTLRLHPYQRAGRERHEYDLLGEAAYLDQKALQFRKAVAADPLELLDRIAARFQGATLWYVPMDRSPVQNPSWMMWGQRLTHPLPFLGLLGLVVLGVRDPLHPAVWTAIAIYWLYLIPYICTSYYDRYAFPLLAVKVLFVVWAFDRLVGLTARTPEFDRSGR